MKLELSILGSSSAMPTHDRNTSSQLIKVGNFHFLIDCGEGTQFALQKRKVSPNSIHSIFISHLHGDHYFGLMPLMSSMHLLGRSHPLYINADRRLESIIGQVFEAADTKLSFPIQYHFLDFNSAQVLFEFERIRISSFPLIHRIPTCGFNVDILSGRIDADDTEKIRYSYCSDTKFEASYLPYIQNATLLYHEATFMNDKRNFAHQKFHSTAEEAARAAIAASAKHLLIGHFSARYRNINSLLDEARNIFPETFPAFDGLNIRLSSDGGIELL